MNSMQRYLRNPKSHCSLSHNTQVQIQDFGQGAQWSFDPKGVGALSPKFAQNRGFPLKLPELPDFEEILGARGLDPLLIPVPRDSATST